MKKIYRSYEEVLNDELLVGYTICKVTTGINEEDSGAFIELEREITNGIIGIDICYDPVNKEIPFTISSEYIKHVSNKGDNHD